MSPGYLLDSLVELLFYLELTSQGLLQLLVLGYHECAKTLQLRFLVLTALLYLILQEQHVPSKLIVIIIYERIISSQQILLDLTGHFRRPRQSTTAH